METQTATTDIVAIICIIGLPTLALVIWTIGDAIEKNRRPK